MMSVIESNDLGFTEIWSNATKMDCGTLFLNPELPNDVFFDKLTDVTCLSEKMIDKSVESFQQIHSVPYVYSMNYPEFENLLERKGFVYYDTQHVLKKRTLPIKKPNAIQITQKNIALWVEIFCRAYDCPEWAKSVTRILENSLSSIDYFIDQSGSSCVALYEKNSILGLYCLGTVPDKRNQGLAASLIDFALNEVYSRNLESLILETYERDNLLGFYSKLGFDKVYCKTIYTI